MLDISFLDLTLLVLTLSLISGLLFFSWREHKSQMNKIDEEIELERMWDDYTPMERAKAHKEISG
ncbi:MAG TPA: hypothetical protein ENI23_15975 [bacterium]|nr:hypothetical protein [bacterium]